MLTTTTSVKASKTWVLPPRPKPGRKSKKDIAAAAAKEAAAATSRTTTSASSNTSRNGNAAANTRIIENTDRDDDESEEAEKLLNRTKQKASRERKQEYIAELEAKVRSYEQGDGERASFFQNLAKTYSEQNAALKRENEELRARVAALESGQAYSRSGTNSTQHQQPTTAANESRPAAHLARKASSDITSQANRFKRQRTKSISSTASASSRHGTTNTTSTASLATTSTSATTAGSAIPQLHAHSPAGSSISSSHTAIAHLYSHSNNNSPSPSSSSYVPPSPPVSLGLSPVFSPQPYPIASTSTSAAVAERSHHQSDTCGLCDTDAGVSCLCQDIGLRDRHANDIEVFEHEGGMGTASLAIANDACGFCTESTTGACICAEVGLRKRRSPKHLNILMDLDDSPMRLPITKPRHASISSSSAAPTTPMINLPPTLPSESKSVRLRLPKRGVAVGQVWRIDMLPAPTSPKMEDTAKQSAPLPPPVPVGPAAAAGVALRRKLIKVGSRLPCSGDPKTCLACADDPAGQAFCSALSSTICSTNPCANCPNRPSPLSKEVVSMPLRPNSPYASESFAAASMPSIKRQDSSARDEVPQAMIPCSDAWATLREHPNIGYANLDMLASVVAKRTQCSGEIRDKDGKIMEVERQGVEEALDLLDHMRDKEASSS